MHCSARRVLALIAFITTTAAAPAAERPTIRVPRVAAAPRLQDFVALGRGEAVATELAKVSGFIQRTPVNGAPVSERTEVYIGYDERELHVVFVCFDAEPKGVRANLSRRDHLGADDQIEIMIDTYADERRAYAFVTNPLGVQWDSLWTEGQGFDPSWDTLWDTDGELTEFGYVVRMSIPFRSLRFSPSSNQRWGVIFLREIQRKNEQTFWPQISSEIEGRLNQAGYLVGIEGISPGRNLQFIPYVGARAFRVLDETAAGGPRLEDDRDADLGLDAKLVVKDTVALDLTVNPDFGQVESDDPQVTVNQRFEQFFPEKRPFFLENANYFVSPIRLLFSRRIADPEVGLRATGKIGAYAIGALVSDDHAPGRRGGGAGEAARIGVFRVARDIGRQSTLGLFVTDRELGDGHSRVAAVDGRVKFDDNWSTRFQLATSAHRASDDARRDGRALEIEIARDGRQFSSFTQYRDISRDVRTDLGFVARRDVRDVVQEASYSFRPEGNLVVSWGPQLFAQWIGDHEGTRLDWQVSPSLVCELPRRSQISLAYNARRERLRAADLPGLTRAIDFAPWSWEVGLRSDLFAWLSGSIDASRGRTVNFVPAAGALPWLAGERTVEAELTLRPSGRLSIENTWLHTRLHQPQSGEAVFADNILRSRWSYQVSRRLSLRAIVELDDTAVSPALTSLAPRRNFNLDLLATWQANAWTAFYLGYNSNYREFAIDENSGGRRLVPSDDLRQDSRQLFVKLSYLVRL